MKRVMGTTITTVLGLVALLAYKTHPPSVKPIGVASAISTTTTTTTTFTSATSSPSKTSNNQGSDGTVATAPSTTTTTTAAPQASRTVTGNAVNTRYGDVQVRLTVSGTNITQVSAPEYPSESNRDLSINSYAIPQLCQEALSAQSAQIDSVSGATYTSTGFISSLQSAINKI